MTRIIKMKINSEQPFDQVVSAIPLTAAQEADVAAAIQGQLEAGQSAKISTAVDSELMGGMTVSIGDKYSGKNDFINQTV